MLNRIEIRSFKSCKGIELSELGSVVALVGRNGAGKTNILRAIEWLGSHASFPASIGASPSRRVGDVKGHFRIGQVEYDVSVFAEEYPEFKCIEEIGITENGTRERLVTRNNGTATLATGSSLQVAPTTSICFTLRTVLAPDDPLRNRLQPLWDQLSGIRYFPLDEQCEPNEPWFVREEDLRAAQDVLVTEPTIRESPIATSLVRLHQFDLPKFEHLRSILCDQGIGLFSDINVRPLFSKEEQKSPRFFIPFVRMPGAVEPEFPLNMLSLGTRRVLRLLIDLLTDPSLIKLLEHPEDAIHRALLKKITSLIRTNADPSQVFFSSHSAVVVDQLEPSSIRVVSFRGGRTVVRALSGTELDDVKHYLDNEGSLSEFLESFDE